MGSKGSSTTKVYTPSAEETADAQTQANLEAIYASTLANRYNEVTPYGTVSWTQAPSTGQTGTPGYGTTPNPGITPRYATEPGYGAYSNYQTTSGAGEISPSDLGGWTRTTTLSPEMQAQFDLQNQLAQSLQSQAVDRSGQLPTDQFSINQNLPSLTTGLNTSGLPQAASGLDTSQFANLATSIDTSGLPDLNQDYSADAAAVEQATYDRIQQLINPQYEERQRALENQLAATGNPIGSEAYQTEQTRFQRDRDEADLAAALEAVGAGRAEQSRLFDIASQTRNQLTGEQLASAGLAQSQRSQLAGEQVTDANMANQVRNQAISEQLTNADLARVARQQGISEDQLVRNQNINELAALIQGSPAITTPTSAEPAQYQVAPADYLGAQQLETQTALQNALSQQQAASAKKGGTTDLIGTLGSAAIYASDKRLKDNLSPLGKINGHEFYTWEWNDKASELGLSGSGFGVIADEVEQYAPHLIVVDPKTGYKHVNYGGL